MSDFPVKSIADAPVGSQPLLANAKTAFGFVPNLLGMLANAPPALEAYLNLSDSFQKSTLSAVEQQVVLLTVSVENECHYCVAAHTAIATSLRVPGAIVTAIRTGRPLSDPKLEALRLFTASVVRERGWALDSLPSFVAAGYRHSQALEVLVGVTQKTLSNYANHLAMTPLDDAFSASGWTPEALDRRAAS